MDRYLVEQALDQPADWDIVAAQVLNERHELWELLALDQPPYMATGDEWHK